MENKSMKRYAILFVAAVMALCSCSKEWTSGLDLGVNSTRVNLGQLSDDFVLTVFSNQTWAASVVEGEWLSLKETGGSGLGYLHCSVTDNLENNARIAKVQLSCPSRTIVVNIVQSGNVETAASVPDNLL